MLQFRPISLADRATVNRYLEARDYPGAQYSFGNLFIWRKTYDAWLCEEGGFLYVRSGKPGEYRFMCPVGSGDLRGAVLRLREWCRAEGCALRLSWVPAEERAMLETLFPGECTVSSNRDTFDYLYERQRLVTLAGRRLQPKRNYLNRIRKKNWSYEPVTRENLAECFAMQQEWCLEHNRCAEGSVHAESCAVRQAFRYFWELELTGGCIRLDGKIVAYTIGEPLNSNTFIVHVEKAFASVEGAYQLINQQFAANAMEGYDYINREDDAGSEGLRRAKLSYDPFRLLEDYDVVFLDRQERERYV